MKDKDRYWDCLDQAMEASHGGRPDEALAWLAEALKVHPGGAEAHNGRGEIHWDEGKVDEALYEFELALRADLKFIAAHLNRAEQESKRQTVSTGRNNAGRLAALRGDVA